MQLISVLAFGAVVVTRGAKCTEAGPFTTNVDTNTVREMLRRNTTDNVTPILRRTSAGTYTLTLSLTQSDEVVECDNMSEMKPNIGSVNGNATYVDAEVNGYVYANDEQSSNLNRTGLSCVVEMRSINNSRIRESAQDDVPVTYLDALIYQPGKVYVVLTRLAPDSPPTFPILPFVTTEDDIQNWMERTNTSATEYQELVGGEAASPWLRPPPEFQCKLRENPMREFKLGIMMDRSAINYPGWNGRLPDGNYDDGRRKFAVVKMSLFLAMASIPFIRQFGFRFRAQYIVLPEEPESQSPFPYPPFLNADVVDDEGTCSWLPGEGGQGNHYGASKEWRKTEEFGKMKVGTWVIFTKCGYPLNSHAGLATSFRGMCRASYGPKENGYVWFRETRDWGDARYHQAVTFAHEFGHMFGALHAFSREKKTPPGLRNGIMDYGSFLGVYHGNFAFDRQRHKKNMCSTLQRMLFSIEQRNWFRDDRTYRLLPPHHCWSGIPEQTCTPDLLLRCSNNTGTDFSEPECPPCRDELARLKRFPRASCDQWCRQGEVCKPNEGGTYSCALADTPVPVLSCESRPTRYQCGEDECKWAEEGRCLAKCPPDDEEEWPIVMPDIESGAHRNCGPSRPDLFYNPLEDGEDCTDSRRRCRVGSYCNSICVRGCTLAQHCNEMQLCIEGSCVDTCWKRHSRERCARGDLCFWVGGADGWCASRCNTKQDMRDSLGNPLCGHAEIQCAECVSENDTMFIDYLEMATTPVSRNDMWDGICAKRGDMCYVLMDRKTCDAFPKLFTYDNSTCSCERNVPVTPAPKRGEHADAARVRGNLHV